MRIKPVTAEVSPTTGAIIASFISAALVGVVLSGVIIVLAKECIKKR